MTLSLAANPPIRLLAAFQGAHAEGMPELIVQTPGREMWALAARASRNCYTLVAPDLDAETTMTHQSARLRQTVTHRPLPGWARHAAAVIVRLGNSGFDVPGLVTVVGGEETLGPRYDYALAMTVAALWHTVLDRPYTMNCLVDVVERARRE